MINKEEKFQAIVSVLDSNEQLQKEAKKGNCRFWAGSALQVLNSFRDTNSDVHIEAREAQIEPSLTHTFLELTIGDDSYVIDQMGASIHGPYTGLKKDAPSYLQNSWKDIINF